MNLTLSKTLNNQTITNATHQLLILPIIPNYVFPVTPLLRSPLLPLLLRSQIDGILHEIPRDIGQFLPVSLGKKHVDEEHRQQRDYSEEPLNASGASEDVVQCPVALDGAEHDHVGNADDKAVTDPPDFHRKEFCSHGERDGEETHH